MLGKIISQLYRIADLLKDKKLVDKDSNNSPQSEDEVRVKPFYYDIVNIVGCLIKEKDVVHVETEQTSLGEIFPNVINDINNIINANFNSGRFTIYVENSTEVFPIVSINSDSNKIEVDLDRIGLEASHYHGNYNNISEMANSVLTQGFEIHS